MRLLACFFASFLFQDSIPYKPADEYEFNMKFAFRNRPGVDHSNVDWTQRGHPEGDLPYVTVTVKALKLSDKEERVKVINNLSERIYAGKASLDRVIEIDMGFTDDLKDHISVFAYDIIFYTKGNEVSLIKLFVDEDGNFFVNGEQRGKF
ncbi:MAG: hypothetical protein RIA63_10170 [Cyclobacteriaceae bacterium]